MKLVEIMTQIVVVFKKKIAHFKNNLTLGFFLIIVAEIGSEQNKYFYKYYIYKWFGKQTATEKLRKRQMNKT